MRVEIGYRSADQNTFYIYWFMIKHFNQNSLLYTWKELIIGWIFFCLQIDEPKTGGIRSGRAQL